MKYSYVQKFVEYNALHSFDEWQGIYCANFEICIVLRGECDGNGINEKNIFSVR